MDFAAELMMSLDSTLGNGDASGNLSDSKELLSFEYHVLYHLSYAVPYICFNANKSSEFSPDTRSLRTEFNTLFSHNSVDGSLMTFDEAWSTFNDPIYGRCGGHRMQMTTVLTQMEHPILFRPFLTVHPCRIAELLHCLPHSENKVLTFLSTIGPAVHLQFDLKYASILQKRIHK